MNIIICVDNRLGTGFNGRRQSRDRILYEKILKKVNGKLVVSPYSAPLFDPSKIRVEDDPVHGTGAGEWCFLENVSLHEIEDRIEKLLICRWNRDYPADIYLDVTLDKWKRESTAEFSGNSHKEITMEIWENEKMYQ
ncbi:ribonuclease Z [Ruminococcus sp. CLA-AA-H200]|uniref:Ribonuclease Z n=1 Tax=Ruminococcus turbiniformis TaxID=2881258 RepID=A0ABS8FZR3_9FIRM|nr:ribonuclease Z [Ruminococcus turbiniformis]MCC2255555.1 ribonuclease Z [Ruminococcus turbiniformis]